MLVDQALELGEPAIALGAGQRRRQVIDDHRLGAALGLRAFAGIVDDEGVEMRQRPERRLGEALGGERQRLARQPFEVTVLPHMHHRLGAQAQGKPGVEGEIAVRRREIGRVIARGGIDVVAAGRLDRHRDIAEAQRGDGDSAAIEPALAEGGVALDRAPALLDLLLRRARQRREKGGVVAASDALLGGAAAAGGGISRAFSQLRDECVAIPPGSHRRDSLRRQARAAPR